jgi:hypothetical protein
VWSDQPFEILLKSRLSELPVPEGESLFADYVTARQYLITQVIEHLRHSEPNLTDHGPRHLQDVLKRVSDLVGNAQRYFNPIELYILGLSVLFHDVGNLHGRKDHQAKIGGIYASVRGTEARFRNERQAVLAIAGAHTGTTKDGSKNALQFVGDLVFHGESIRGKELASVLRLADELAEGPQRTSAYMLNIAGYSLDSRVYHAYANAAEYAVDCHSVGRIAMTFNINLHKSNGVLMAADDVTAESLLDLCYHRIVKLDQERRYCKHFTSILRDLAETWAWFNFYYDNHIVDLSLTPLVLSDLVIPGDHAKTVAEHDKAYSIADLLPRLAAMCS